MLLPHNEAIQTQFPVGLIKVKSLIAFDWTGASVVSMDDIS